MKWRQPLILTSFLLLCACRDRLPPDAYRNPLDQLAVMLGADFLGYTPCSKRISPDGIEMLSAEDCLTAGEPRKLRGTWAVGFETNQLVIGSGPMASNLPPDQYSLSGEVLPWKRLNCGMDDDACRFKIEFIGRRSSHRAYHGQYIYVVDRLISMRPIYATRSSKDESVWVSPKSYFAR